MLVVGYGLNYFAFKKDIADDDDLVNTSALKSALKPEKKSTKPVTPFWTYGWILAAAITVALR